MNEQQTDDLGRPVRMAIAVPEAVALWLKANGIGPQQIRALIVHFYEKNDWPTTVPPSKPWPEQP